MSLIDKQLSREEKILLHIFIGLASVLFGVWQGSWLAGGFMLAFLICFV